MSSIEEIKLKIQPEFASKEHLYSYAADNSLLTISSKQAQQDISANLLPIFQAAKELCEQLSQDDEYFKRGHMVQLFHMALVSRMIKNINNNCSTTEEKLASIHYSQPHYGGMLYFKNGKKETKQSLFEKKEDRGFKNLMSKAIGCSYDDQYTTIYFGAFQEDVQPVYDPNGTPKCSVSGGILSWENLKNSAVLQIAAQSFIYQEVKKICQKNGTPLSNYGIHYKQAEQNIQVKINEFCDMKQAQLIKQKHKLIQHDVKN